MFRNRKIMAMVFVVIGGFGSFANAQEFRQPYLIPHGFENYPAGTMIEYGGNDYLINAAHVMYFVGQAPPHTLVAAPAVNNVAPAANNNQNLPAYHPAYSHSSGGPGFFGPGFSHDFLISDGVNTITLFFSCRGCTGFRTLGSVFRALLFTAFNTGGV